MSYHHLTIEERACIAQYLKNGLNQSQIAELLHRDRSTISREIRRNRNCLGEYAAVGANRKYHTRRKAAQVKPKLISDRDLYDRIIIGLQLYFSPEQIVSTLPSDCHISVSTIYRAVSRKLFPKIATEIASRYNISVTTAIRYFDCVGYRCKELPEVLSIDEFVGNAGGYKYQSIITDPQNKKILDIFSNRYEADLIRYFKKSKFLLRKNPEKLTVEDMDRLATMFEIAPRLADAYRLKNEFFEIMRSENSKIGKSKLVDWLFQVECKRSTMSTSHMK